MSTRQFFEQNTGFGFEFPGSDEDGHAMMRSYRMLKLKTSKQDVLWGRAYEIKNICIMNGIVVLQICDFSNPGTGEFVVLTIQNRAMEEQHPNHLLKPLMRDNFRLERVSQNMIELQIADKTYRISSTR